MQVGALAGLHSVSDVDVEHTRPSVDRHEKVFFSPFGIDNNIPFVQ